jgi:hypothetical protein
VDDQTFHAVTPQAVMAAFAPDDIEEVIRAFNSIDIGDKPEPEQLPIEPLLEQVFDELKEQCDVTVGRVESLLANAAALGMPRLHYILLRRDAKAIEAFAVDFKEARDTGKVDVVLARWDDIKLHFWRIRQVSHMIADNSVPWAV